MVDSHGIMTSGEEPTDGDHVVELQVSGTDNIKNVWPLNNSENRHSGSKLSRYEIEGSVCLLESVVING